MKKISEIVAGFLTAAVVSLSACSSQVSVRDNPDETSGVTNGNSVISSSYTETVPPNLKNGRKIGVAMPTKTLQRWNQDGDYIKEQLDSMGYEVDLQYADDKDKELYDDAKTQIGQIKAMIAEDCDVLVIAAVDGESLTDVLEEAKVKSIPVIAYDRLIMNTDAVTYYATFDNVKVGEMQGAFIEEKLNLKAGGGPYNIEFFAGDPPDNNSNYFFDGAMSVLRPYLESGVLVCPSGQTEKLDGAVKGWISEVAEARMANLIALNNYNPEGVKLDAVLCPNDSTANGVTDALVKAGYAKDNFPIVTGQDCDIISVRNMIAGTQSMSIFKDTRELSSKAVEMVGAVVEGTEPPINDCETYYNGARVIPAFQCVPVIATVVNYRALLIDTGYYGESDLSG